MSLCASLKEIGLQETQVVSPVSIVLELDNPALF